GQSGTFSGNIVVEALLGDLTMTGRTGKNAFAKIGHAAFSTSSGSSGTILVTVGGNISMKSGGSTTLDMDHADNVNHYTQIGHGWEQGSASDSITVTAGGSLTMHGGIGRNSHSIIGHSAKAGTTLSGAITLNITGATEMKAGPGRDSYVVIGHDSRGTGNTLSGAIVLNTANLVMVGGYLHSANIAGASVTGLRSYARIGHGGYDAGGTFSDKIEVNSLGSISLTGGSDAVGQYAQIGHGGRGANATMSGDVVVLALGGDLTLQGGGTTDSYAMIGHGSDMNSAGTRQGSMHLFARGTLSATDGTGTNSRAHVAHQSGNGLAAANYLGGTGYQLRGSSAVNVAGASLAGVETMINANLATGPVQVAVDKVIDFAITGTAATRNAADLMYIVTGGAISFQRSYQNTGAGGVALVAGWDGATGLPGNVAFTQFGTIDTNAIATAGAFARGAKGVTLGATGQGNSVAVGGKTGDTFVAGHFVNLYGGNSGTAYAQIGYRAVVQDDDATGNVSVEAGAGGVLLQGGGTSNAYVQIGHGGLLTGTNSLTKQLSGNISVRADRGSATVGDVRVLSGSATSYAHIGHGGQWNNGTFGGNILVTGNAITIQSTRRYAQIGHGGLYANGAFTGDIDVNYLRGSDPTTPGTVVGGGGLLKIQAGNGTDDYAMLGHGGVVSSGGIRSGDIHVGMSSGIEVKGGIWRTVYGQIGHGGFNMNSNTTGT
ncbi:MAG TPA: hypothetical protein PLA50_01575, partial [Bacteroidia bacterium]|nr:hypothetical protein [Bacteroidia bacterium]